MTHLQLPQDVINTIRSHGWSDVRNVDIQGVVRELNNNRIDVHAVATSFLQEFHGIRLLLPDGGLTEANFDVYSELLFLEPDELPFLESIVGRGLCPVGLGGRFLFFISPTGEFTFLHDEWMLVMQTASVEDAIILVCRSDFSGYKTITLTDEQKPRRFRDVG